MASSSTEHFSLGVPEASRKYEKSCVGASFVLHCPSLYTLRNFPT